MKNIISYNSFSLTEGNIETDLGYIDPDETIGVLYSPSIKVMYVGSSESNLNYTVSGVETREQADEIIGILKDSDYKVWAINLKDAGFEIADGGKYFELTK